MLPRAVIGGYGAAPPEGCVLGGMGLPRAPALSDCLFCSACVAGKPPSPMGDRVFPPTSPPPSPGDALQGERTPPQHDRPISPAIVPSGQPVSPVPPAITPSEKTVSPVPATVTPSRQPICPPAVTPPSESSTPQRDRPVPPAATPSGQPVSPIPAAAAPSAESISPWCDRSPPGPPQPPVTEHPKEEASPHAAGQPVPVHTAAAPCPAETLPRGSQPPAPAAGEGAPSDAKSPPGGTAGPSKDVPPRSDRPTPAAASPAPAASPRPKQGGCLGGVSSGALVMPAPHGHCSKPPCPAGAGTALGLGGGAGRCSDRVSLLQMPKKPRRGTSRRRSGARSGPSTWVRGWGSRVGRGASEPPPGTLREGKWRRGGEAGAKELYRLMGNPISCDELSPGRSCCAGDSAPPGPVPGTPPLLLPRSPGCSPRSGCLHGCPPICAQPSPLRGQQQAAAGSPAAARGGRRAGPLCRAWGLLVPVLFPPSFPHCSPARHGSAGSRPPFCPRPNPSLTGRP